MYKKLPLQYCAKKTRSREQQGSANLESVIWIRQIKLSRIFFNAGVTKTNKHFAENERMLINIT